MRELLRDRLAAIDRHLLVACDGQLALRRDGPSSRGLRSRGEALISGLSLGPWPPVVGIDELTGVARVDMSRDAVDVCQGNLFVA
jgi:hypothetical protein